MNNTQIKKIRSLSYSVVTLLVFAAFAGLFFTSSVPLKIAGVLAMCVCIVYYFTGCHNLVYTPNNEKVIKKEYHFKNLSPNALKERVELGKIDELISSASKDGQGELMLKIWKSKKSKLELAQLYIYVPFEYQPLTELKVVA